ncbi:hypothetical protein MTR_4g011010 [Medicago truncatula]|uniref:Uncharacterized protein n=1 Tax=Medicago truncatula TaxID=3880 RepID=A0A072UGY2_MEDTR|nr:hypothetical protein MTR_4g011010 [Medicago truncatula]
MTLLSPAAVNCREAMRRQLTPVGFQRQLTVVAFCHMNSIGVSKTPLLRIEDQEVPFFFQLLRIQRQLCSQNQFRLFELLGLGFDRRVVYVNMSQNQGNVELNKKKEGDDKKMME